MFKSNELKDHFGWNIKVVKSIFEEVCCHKFIQVLKYNAKCDPIYSGRNREQVKQKSEVT